MLSRSLPAQPLKLESRRACSRSIRGPWWTLLLLCSLGLLGHPASARSPRRPPEAEDAAQEALLRGRRALQACDLATAGSALSAAYRAQPSPLALYQLGRLAQAEGRTLDAYDLMRRFLADPELDIGSTAPASATPPAPPATPPATPPTQAPTQAPTSAAAAAPESELQAAVREAERVVESPAPPAGSLSIRGERGTLIFVDGRVVGSLPLPLPLLVSPAEHKIALSRGTGRIEDQVQILAGRAGELRTDVTSGALVLSLLPGVLLIEDWRDVAESLRPRLLQAAEKGLLSHRLSPLTREFALSLAPTPKLAGCLGESSCQIELARKVEAEAVLSIRVRQQASAQLLRVGLLDLEVGEEAGADEQTCNNCTPEQLVTALVDLVSRVYENSQGRTRGTLQVVAQPDDAEILIDGRAVGRTPYKHVLFSGKHQITVRRETYQPEVRDVTLRAGEQRQVEVQLSQAEPSPPPLSLVRPMVLRRTARPIWRIVLGSGLIAGGLLTFGFGVAAAAVNGSCAGTSINPGGECREVYATAGLAGGLIPAGLLLGAGGAALIAIPGPMRLVEARP